MAIKFDGTIDELDTTGIFSRSRQVFAAVNPNGLQGTDAALYALAGGVLTIASHLIRIDDFDEIVTVLKSLYKIEVQKYQDGQRG
ncbi:MULTISPECIES: hypothetical protein [Frankia]|uniref:Uncharacterized protein n=1 Tax=Frankia umida TaxID=573489 RepID=A0ABT0JYI8_9ACTN|nr:MULTISPECIES: hypothetical protein [Frankia]MCK9876605.1 hypothetical protein [Frankia umida]MCM3886149.1 hypothetical protein [Frankia sp. R82]